MRTNYFGSKSQGLSTPSQERWVHYFYNLVRKPELLNKTSVWNIGLIECGPVYKTPNVEYQLQITN
eukprot:UN01125